MTKKRVAPFVGGRRIRKQAHGARVAEGVFLRPAGQKNHARGGDFTAFYGRVRRFYCAGGEYAPGQRGAGAAKILRTP